MAGKKQKDSRPGNARTENLITLLCLVVSALVVVLSQSDSNIAPWTRKMTSLQYANADGTFRSGMDDWYIIAFLVLVLTVLRKASQELIFRPLTWLFSITKPSDVLKYQQQGWVFLYYAIAFSWGLAEILQSPYWMNRHALWQGYPQTKQMSQTFKLYMMFQSGFWFHMLFVTIIEPWQKDFVVMILHHIVTIIMLVGAYGIGTVRLAHAILVEQDFADVFLPLAKMTNYVALGGSPHASKFQALADGLFAWFAVAWIPTRHVLLPYLYWTMWTEADTDFLAAGCDCGQGKACVYAPELGCVLTSETFKHAVTFYKWFLGFFQILLMFWLRDLVVAVYKSLAKGSIKGVEESSSQIAGADKKKQ